MKIDLLLSSFDEQYTIVSKESGMNIFEFLLQVFGITDENSCEPLAVASAKLKQMIKTNPDMPDYSNAECLSDVTMLMHTLLTRLHVTGITNGLQYLAEHGTPETLFELKESLLEMQDQSTSEYLTIYKQVCGIAAVDDILPGAYLQDGRLIRCNGSFGKCANYECFAEFGLCYTTSPEDVHKIEPNRIVCANQIYPIYVNRNRMSAEALADVAECIKAKGVNINIPVVSI